MQGFEHRWAGLPSGESVADHVKKSQELKNEVDFAADELTDRAIAWLATVPSSQPIHLLVNYFDPHEPYRTQPGFEVDAPAPGWRRHRRARLRYDSEIRFMDHHFGRLLQALKDDGRYDDALVVVVADHGESFGEHENGGHGPWLYEEVLRVPLLIHFPKGRDAGKVVDAPVSTVDLLPLVAKEVGFPLPPNVEGVPIGERDLVLAEAHRSDVFTRLAPDRYDRDLVAAIRWPWKLIVPDVGGAELYRLDDDPTELRDRNGDIEGGPVR
ncbi:MAG: hypothetical protein FJ144_14770 [Deltaproteobacteria bacterium]|nr:hypothetical protein [Deltaproteobacteria bacterium]